MDDVSRNAALHAAPAGQHEAPELAQCPFCGCLPDGIAQGDGESKSPLWVIKCPDCPCCMRFFSSSFEQAAQAWNRRA